MLQPEARPDTGADSRHRVPIDNPDVINPLTALPFGEKKPKPMERNG